MEFNGFQLGSLLTATEEQFISLYQYRTQNDQNEFVESYKEMQKNELKEVEKLKEMGVTPQQVEEKLLKIIETTKIIYESRVKNNIKSPTEQYRGQYIDVFEEGFLFRVSGFDYFAKTGPWCHICTHMLSRATTYQIENMNTKKKISVSDEELHNIKSHQYYGGNLIKFSNALDLVK